MPPKKKDQPRELMVVNDAPGEECRIAILQDQYLEELYSERTATATNVGNIYKGRVVNVESAIQAAFVDFGEGQNGFLHISDLHPRYFPGKERTERVGKKIPRRERPPIQEALRRGDEILVQVLKEGLGTKGPTLTSYLSIPGRLIVAMPDMDRVGVSRRVEDEQKRREMRQILDQLDLPDGFGFILRTAGFGQPKTELKRDVAYLMRLWKVMDKRIEGVGAPCELYTESDLLIRTVRDVLRPSIDAIVVDSRSAYERASAFLKVVAPRTAPQVIRYRRKTPIFHAFDIERQIELIHSREVPLPSGGKLVIEQTEALVAIDVNSGRSRSAQDSETNAYRTNCEAVDEIARQLRLRDLGGLIVNDLIDMFAQRHRRDVEDRFKQLLKLDRAKTTVARISQFGILEMTRQRMRPSMRKSHFVPCPHCDGHGEIKSAESVGADAMRQIGYLLQYERVQRVEIACSPRVASVLLSARRRDLVRLEDDFNKKIQVRVSDAIADDRVDYYAYDERNADIDIARLPALDPPRLKDLQAEEPKSEQRSVEAVTPDGDETEQRSKRKRRRRRKKPGPADATTIALQPVPDEQPDEPTQPEAPRKKRSRRRRKKRESADAVAAESAPPQPAAPANDAVVRIHELAKEIGVPSKEIVAFCQDDDRLDARNHMSAVRGEQVTIIRDWFDQVESTPVSDGKPTSDGTAETDEPKRRRRRGRRGGKRRSKQSQQSAAPVESDDSNNDASARKNGKAPAQQQGSRSQGKKELDELVEPTAAPAGVEGDAKPRKKRRRSRKKTAESAPESTAQNTPPEPNATVDQGTPDASNNTPPADSTPAKKPRRRLYRNRTRVSAEARAAATEADA